jgi:hypothetical protein
MPENKRTTEQILADSQRALDTAELGYTLLLKPIRNRLSGLMNVAAFGVSVTQVLHHLKHIETGYDQWYKKYKEEMEHDQLMKFFWNLRTDILHNGELTVGSFCQIKKLNLPQDLAMLPPPPAGLKVVGIAIGDEIGGSGYDVQIQDGSIQRFYFDMPKEIFSSKLVLPNPPRMHLGKVVADPSVEMLSRLYLDYLQKLLKDAKNMFSKNPKS